MARAKKKKYKNILLDSTVKIPKTGQKDDDGNLKPRTEDKKLIAEKNDLAYGDLISAMDAKKEGGKVAFNIIKGTKNKDYEDGNAQVAWKNLEHKYKPKNAPSLIKITKEFYNLKLKKKGDPDVFITKLEDLRTQMEEMDSCMEDRQFMTYILNNLPVEYENQVNLLEKKLCLSGNDKLTLEELREDLSLRYERMNPGGTYGSDGGKEDWAMVAGSNGKRCHQCGKIDHFARNCNNKTRPQGFNNKFSKKTPNKKPGNKFNGECFYCHKKGHMKADCYQFQRDSKKGGEHAEVALTCMEDGWLDVGYDPLKKDEENIIGYDICLMAICW